MASDEAGGSTRRGVRLILASGSPRRHELLDLVGIRHDVAPGFVDETSRGEEPGDLVGRLAIAKATAVARERTGDVVLGADSVVEVDGAVLGKPSGPADALAMLSRLQGRTHSVLSGVALVRDGGTLVERHVERTRVTMRRASEDELRRYVASGEPLDKAGAYAIQGEGRALVCEIEGCYTNVVGLPLCVVCRWLDRRVNASRNAPEGPCRKADVFWPMGNGNSATLA